MKRKTIIVHMTPIPECWGNLKFFCESHKISYSTYSRKKMPFKVKGCEVHKVPFKSGKLIE